MKFIAEKFKTKSGEDSTQNQDEGTDTEQHESLPEDVASTKDTQPQTSTNIKSSSSDSNNTTTHNIPLKSDHLKKRNSDLSDTKLTHIKSSKNSNIKQNNNDISKYSRNRLNRSSSRSTSSGEPRRDSVSSVRSENIPIITISKTESDECILNKQEKSVHNIKPSAQDVAGTSTGNSKSIPEYKPKIKYALKKQDAQIDIDSISYIHSKEPFNLQEILIKSATEDEVEAPSGSNNALKCSNDGSSKSSESSKSNLSKSYKDTAM